MCIVMCAVKTAHWAVLMYYHYFQYLADIEDHLGVTIDQVQPDLKVAANQFDGKVVYGQKRRNTGMMALYRASSGGIQVFFQIGHSFSNYGLEVQ